MNHPEGLVSSIPSRALDVWRRLYTRFSLEPGPASIAPDVLKTIVPVTNVDVLLQVVTPFNVTLNLDVAGNIQVAGYTVPVGRRATILYARRGSSTGSTSMQVVVAGVTLILSPGGTTEAFLGTTISQPIVIDEGDTFGMSATDDVNDGGISFRGLVLEEESF